MYLIITKGQEIAKNKQGVLTNNEIKGILKHPEDGVSGELPFLEGVTYEPEHCQYILEIMHQHYLSYQTEDGDEFIPALCPTNRPENLEPIEWVNASEGRKKESEYKLKFSYLPETILHRLMIKFYGCLRKTKCWYNGLRIDFPGKDYSIIAESGRESETISIRILTWGNANSNEFFPAFREEICKICEDLDIKKPTDYVARYGDFKVLRDLIMYAAINGLDETERFSVHKVSLKDIFNDFYKPRAIQYVVELQKKYLPKNSQLYDANYFTEELALRSAQECSEEKIIIKTTINVDEVEKINIKQVTEVSFDGNDIKNTFSYLTEHVDKITEGTVTQISLYLGNMIDKAQKEILESKKEQNQYYVDIIRELTNISEKLQDNNVEEQIRLKSFLTDASTIATLIGFLQQNQDFIKECIEFFKGLVMP